MQALPHLGRDRFYIAQNDDLIVFKAFAINAFPWDRNWMEKGLLQGGKGLQRLHEIKNFALEQGGARIAVNDHNASRSKGLKGEVKAIVFSQRILFYANFALV